MKFSPLEQRVVAFASEQFGEPLTRFLLAGLGEREVDRRWRFTISYGGGEGSELERRIQVISHEPEDGSSCLPRGRDPLVFLALLQLLMSVVRTPDYELLYDQEGVLEILGWSDTPEARIEMDRAVKRYFLMFFKWEMNRAELARENLAYYTAMERPISECENLDEEENGRARRVSNRVVFNDIFIEGLRRRRLFHIDWNEGIQITRAPAPSK